MQWGRTHPTEFYRLTGRLIPQEIKSQTDAVLTIVHALPPTALDLHPAQDGGSKNITQMVPYEEHRTPLAYDKTTNEPA